MPRWAGSKLTWLWALVLLLSVIKGSSTLWLPAGSPLHPTLCRWMPGLATCPGDRGPRSSGADALLQAVEVVTDVQSR